MTDTKRTRLVRKKKVRIFGGRGPIYCWLRTHHAAIEPLRAVHLNLWAALAADMIEDGITEAAEGRGLRDRIWKSWQRVCRDVAATAAAKPKRVPPSRISPAWRPTTVPPRPAAATATVGQQTSSGRAILPSGNVSLVDPKDPPHVQAQMAKLDATFEEDARRRLPR